MLAQPDPQVATTRVGLVQNGLSQLNGCAARPQFVVQLCRGLGGGLAPSVRAELVAFLFQVTKSSNHAHIQRNHALYGV